MTFNIEDFRQTVDSGMLKPDRYRVRFPIPQAMQNLTYYSELYNTNRYLEFYSDSIDFAGVGVATHDIVRYGYGPSEKSPIAGVFNPVMITFYNDSQAMNYLFFEQWMNIVSNLNMLDGISGADGVSSPYEIFYKDDYVADGMVTLIDNNDNEVATWRYRRMYPIEIPHMKLGWSITNDVQRVTVMFTFTDKYVDPTLGGSMISILQNDSQIPATQPPNPQ